MVTVRLPHWPSLWNGGSFSNRNPLWSSSRQLFTTDKLQRKLTGGSWFSRHTSGRRPNTSARSQHCPRHVLALASDMLSADTRMAWLGSRFLGTVFSYHLNMIAFTKHDVDGSSFAKDFFPSRPAKSVEIEGVTRAMCRRQGAKWSRAFFCPTP